MVLVPHIRWSLANELGLVVVALYQKSLQLQYVEELVDNIKRVRLPIDVLATVLSFCPLTAWCRPRFLVQRRRVFERTRVF